MANISVSLSGENNDPITEINCGQSTFRVGGDVNISLFPELTGFYCTGFDIKSINISGNKKLKRLEIFDNKITQLPSSLQVNTGLNYFNCSKNNIAGSIPDIRFNSALAYFNCSGNDFTGFQGTYIDNNLKTFYANNNKLYSPFVDNILNAIDLNGSTNGILDLSNGGNQPPSITNIKVKQVAGTSFKRAAGSFEVTVTLANHGYITDDILTIENLLNSTLNGTFIITVISPNQFKYTSLTQGSLTGSGTATITSSSGLNDGFKKYQKLTLPISQGGKGWNVKISPYFIKQLGDTISGNQFLGAFGSSVAINAVGNRVVIGIPLYGSSEGAIQIFDWDGENWNLVSSFAMPSPSFGAGFGTSVAINDVGNIVAVGAPGAVVNSANRGRVFIYKESNGVWSLKASQNGSNANALFGFSVSLNSIGDRIAVGEKNYSTFVGSASIYSIGSSSLTQLGADIEGVQNYEEFGASVSLNPSGNKVLIGGPGFNDGYGVARLYKFETLQWVQEKEFSRQEFELQKFGTSVSLKTIYRPEFEEADRYSDIVAIGASGPEFAKGFAVRYQSYTFESAPNQYSTSWSSVIFKGELSDENFGSSVSLNNSGNYLVVGARGSYDDNRGQTRIFKETIALDPNNPNISYVYWEQLGVGVAGLGVNDQLGTSVSMNNDGSRFVVGGSSFAKVYELLD
jgi:hypothetical protein